MTTPAANCRLLGGVAPDLSAHASRIAPAIRPRTATSASGGRLASAALAPAGPEPKNR
jgi:hypothetical protein